MANCRDTELELLFERKPFHTAFFVVCHRLVSHHSSPSPSSLLLLWLWLLQQPSLVVPCVVLCAVLYCTVVQQLPPLLTSRFVNRPLTLRCLWSCVVLHCHCHAEGTCTAKQQTLRYEPTINTNGGSDQPLDQEEWRERGREEGGEEEQVIDHHDYQSWLFMTSSHHRLFLLYPPSISISISRVISSLPSSIDWAGLFIALIVYQSSSPSCRCFCHWWRVGVRVVFRLDKRVVAESEIDASAVGSTRNSNNNRDATSEHRHVNGSSSRSKRSSLSNGADATSAVPLVASSKGAVVSLPLKLVLDHQRQSSSPSSTSTSTPASRNSRKRKRSPSPSRPVATSTTAASSSTTTATTTTPLSLKFKLTKPSSATPSATTPTTSTPSTEDGVPNTDTPLSSRSSRTRKSTSKTDPNFVFEPVVAKATQHLPSATCIRLPVDQIRKKQQQQQQQQQQPTTPSTDHKAKRRKTSHDTEDDATSTSTTPAKASKSSSRTKEKSTNASDTTTSATAATSAADSPTATKNSSTPRIKLEKPPKSKADTPSKPATPATTSERPKRLAGSRAKTPVIDDEQPDDDDQQAMMDVIGSEDDASSAAVAQKKKPLSLVKVCNTILRALTKYVVQ
jgi:hypothetical protein